MNHLKTRLREEGVSSDTLDSVLDAIAHETRAVFEDYDVPLDEPEAVSRAVQTTILETVIDFGTRFDDRTVSDQFDLLAEDFAETGAQSARSNILFALGATEPPEHLADSFAHVGGAILARNYGHTSE